MTGTLFGAPAGRDIDAAVPSRAWPRTPAVGASSVVILSDLLPGRAGSGTTICSSDLVDDPTTVALLETVSRARGAWIGRGGGGTRQQSMFRRRPLDLDPAEVGRYDLGHSQSTIWPLYHDLGRSVYDQGWHAAYLSVNTAFATAAAQEAARGGTVLVHGYKLQLVPGILRRLRPDLRIALYVQTLFPAAEVFQYMPMHQELVRGVLAADLVGFQTAGAAESFLRLTQESSDAPPSVGVFPTAADSGAIRVLANRPDVADRAARFRKKLGDPHRVIVSINTPDDTQGIERRLLGLGDMFRDGQLNPADTVVIQIVLGENDAVDRSSADGVARAAARVNGQHASIGRPCLHYLISRPDLAERVVLYLAADVLLATPLREGSTTCALEFAACAREDAALVLSEFSGTADVLPTAFVVNPHDDEAVKAALLASLMVPIGDRAERMRRMREYVMSYDNYDWAHGFLSALRTVSAPHLERSAVNNRFLNDISAPGCGGTGSAMTLAYGDP
jgi:trehalose 6-phosphate synthase